MTFGIFSEHRSPRRWSTGDEASPEATVKP